MLMIADMLTSITTNAMKDECTSNYLFHINCSFRSFGISCEKKFDSSDVIEIMCKKFTARSLFKNKYDEGIIST